MPWKGITRIASVAAIALLLAGLIHVTTQRSEVSRESHIAKFDAPTSSTTDVDQAENAGQAIAALQGSATSQSYSGANTPEDIEWLVRNGYPSDEMIELALHGRGQGASLHFTGETQPEAILDAEQLALNDPDRQRDALQFLSQNAQAGSIYALEVMSSIYQDGQNPDAVRARAYMKAAELRGNWAAGVTPLKYTLTSQDEIYATIMAHQVIRNIALSRERRRLPPLLIDTRPGLENLVREISEQSRRGK